VTKVNVSLDNTLSAASQQGTSAFIQKKDADGLIITVDIVPEPSSAVVGLLAVAMGGGLVRRRR
jgi:MYXO-CTERM domain-containing protein